MVYEDENFEPLFRCTFDKKAEKAEKAEKAMKAMKEAVNVAVKKMHSKGLVHGDLRDTNILYCRGGSCDSVLLIDWDSTDEEGKASYLSGNS